MSNNRANLQKHAMYYGTYMGLFWIVKFAFFPIGLSKPFFLFLFVAATLTVPFLAHRFAKKFRDEACGGAISFSQAWVFLVFLFLFSSLLAAVGHYIYFQFIDNGYILETYTGIINNLPGDSESIQVYKEQLTEALDLVGNMTSIEITMQLLSSNILNCSVLSLIISFFIKKKRTDAVDK